MSYGVINYLCYLVISISLTIWVGSVLFRNGRIFLIDALGKKDLADSVNHLLIVGFYLVNFGYVLLRLKVDIPPQDTMGLIEKLSIKVGVVLLILGGMHFFNMFLLNKLRKRSHVQETTVNQERLHENTEKK